MLKSRHYANEPSQHYYYWEYAHQENEQALACGVFRQAKHIEKSRSPSQMKGDFFPRKHRSFEGFSKWQQSRKLFLFYYLIRSFFKTFGKNLAKAQLTYIFGAWSLKGDKSFSVLFILFILFSSSLLISSAKIEE